MNDPRIEELERLTKQMEREPSRLTWLVMLARERERQFDLNAQRADRW